MLQMIHNIKHSYVLNIKGDYICQIGDQETRDQVHTVEILGESIKSNRQWSLFG